MGRGGVGKEDRYDGNKNAHPDHVEKNGEKKRRQRTIVHLDIITQIQGPSLKKLHLRPDLGFTDLLFSQ